MVDEIEALLLAQEELLKEHKLTETSILQANTVSASQFPGNYNCSRYQHSRGNHY